MSGYRDPSLALQDAVYNAIRTFAAGNVFYDVPDDVPLPWIAFGNDDITSSFDNGDFADATVNIDVYAGDKITLKQLVGQVVEALNAKLAITGFDVIEWRYMSTIYTTIEEGAVEQASLEFDYLIQPTD